MGKRVGGVLFLIVCLMLGYLFLRKPAPAPVVAQAAEPEDELARASRPSSLSKSLAGVPLPEGDPKQPIIDSVELEKSEVCVGEENLATVKAHTPEHGEDGYLHYRAGGSGSPFLVFHGEKPDPEDGDISKHDVMVFGRDNVSAVSRTTFKVKPCVADYRVMIVNSQLRNSTDEYEFGARVMSLGAHEKFVPVSFEWNFGDGQTLTTAESLVNHDFSARPQDRLYNHFLVSVTAVDAGGKRITGRVGLELRSPGFDNLVRAGVVTLFVKLTPRLAVADENGIVTQSYKVWHNSPGSVHIAELRQSKVVLRDPQEAAKGSAPREEQHVDPLTIMGAQDIPPGPAGIEFTLKLDTRAEDKVAFLNYHMTGEARDGTKAVGMFALMRPAELPTRERHVPIQNDVMQARIRRAMEMTGKTHITGEDMRKLAVAGAFDDIRPQPARHEAQ